MSSHIVVMTVYDSRELIIFLCSSALDRRILSVCTLAQFVSSDHKPMIATFNDLVVNTSSS